MKQHQTLSNGKKLPLIGFGTWYLTGDEGIEVIKNAIKSGSCKRAGKHPDTGLIPYFL